MKIEVQTPDTSNITISLPNALLFSSALWNGVLKIGNNAENIPDIPPEVTLKACLAIKDFNKTHKNWELVHVETSDGDIITITI